MFAAGRRVRVGQRFARHHVANADPTRQVDRAVIDLAGRKRNGLWMDDHRVVVGVKGDVVVGRLGTCAQRDVVAAHVAAALAA